MIKSNKIKISETLTKLQNLKILFYKLSLKLNEMDFIIKDIKNKGLKNEN